MTTGVEIVNQALEMLKEGDFESYETLLDENMYFKMTGNTPLSGEAHSKTEFLATVGRVMDYLKDPIKLELKEIIDGGDTIVSISTGSSTTKKGEAYNNEYCHVWKVKNNKIVSLIEYLDTQMLSEMLNE
tara:strand:+ start:208 stop:597 length:390 start_codon:yes stop_codon:yes gene_type:complete